MAISTTVDKKSVYAGIDFHKKMSVVTLGDSTGEQVGKQHKIENNEHDVRKFFLRHSPLICAIENCRGIEWFVETLKACGCEVRVANTRAVKLIAETAKKNDKIDSKILMELVARSYLPLCYQPTQNERILREKVRWRTKLMRSRTQYKNIAHALMNKENKTANLEAGSRRNRLQQKSGLTKERHELLKDCVQVIDFFEQKMDAREWELQQLASANPDVQRLKTIPGVGDISAMTLFAELGDVKRFKSARHVAGYLGLVPRLYASSDTRRLGSITKQGPGAVRRILVQDAWMAVRVSKPFRSCYNSILKRRGKRTAIVAIARKIAEIAYHILKEQTEFDEKKMTLG